MTYFKWTTVISACLVSATIGCAPSPTPPANAVSSTNGAKFIAKTEPENAIGVGSARETSKDDEDVVLVGRIGGSTKPFVEGVAAFTIVDPKVPYCAKEEGCKTPWDYCCKQNEVKDNIATVKIVNGETKAVQEDARKLLGVKELNMVVIKGKAKRDEAGNLTVLADQVFVKE